MQDQTDDATDAQIETVTDDGVERDWDYVEGVIRDLKIDGYEVTEFESDTSNARPKKTFLLRVERIDSND